MRYLPIILIIALAAIPLNASAHGAVIVVIDSLGSSYLSPNTATYTGGTPIPSLDLKFVDMADARYQLKVPVPATEYGHAVIVTGDSNASQETVALYHATIFDALKDDGYLALGILENGDSAQMLAELDAAVREKNDSVYDPYFQYIQHGNSVPPDLARMMQDYPVLNSSKAGKDKYAGFIKYNNWSLDFTRDLVTFMGTHEPDVNYVLLVNAGGLDHSGHTTGSEGYKTVLSGLEPEMESLVDVCRASGAILMITGDHGMSFTENSLSGAHAGASVASRKESLMTPLLIYSNKTIKGIGGTYGQECLSPTMLSLLDEPNTMSLSNGEPLPVKDKPTLFLKSRSPENVTITGNNYSVSASVNGIYRLEGLDKGDYTVSYGDTHMNVHLAHDELINIVKSETKSSSGVQMWAIYLALAVVAVVGICVALKLVWRK